MQTETSTPHGLENSPKTFPSVGGLTPQKRQALQRLDEEDGAKYLSAKTRFVPPAVQRLELKQYFAGLREMRRPSVELATERVGAFLAECERMMRENGVDKPEFGEASLLNLNQKLPQNYRALAAVLLKLLSEAQQLAIVGNRGTGKTYLACAAVNAFCEAHRPALYRRTRDLFNELSKAEWSRKDQVRHSFLAPELLVLDEVQERDGDRAWQDSELTDLIDRRWSRHRSTILLGNFVETALMENLKGSIHRRIIESGGVWVTDWGRIKEINLD